MNPTPSEQTPHTLIEELATGSSPLSWERFLFLYQPLLDRWLRQALITTADSHDLIQDTLVVVLRRIPEFQHNGQPGAFRNWLKQILHHKVQAFRRTKTRNATTDSESTNLLEDSTADLDLRWDAEHDRELLRRLLQLTKPAVSPQWWEAFYRTAILGEETATVAKELGITLNTVYIARSRVMAQLRKMSRGLVDSDDINPKNLADS
jgi:RNA polymerase sigma-70 factor, ECF subfamily